MALVNPHGKAKRLKPLLLTGELGSPLTQPSPPPGERIKVRGQRL